MILQPIVVNHIPATDRSDTSSTAALSEGGRLRCVSSRILAPVDLKRGECYVSISLRFRGSVLIARLFADYVHIGHDVAWDGDIPIPANTELIVNTFNSNAMTNLVIMGILELR